MRPRFVVIGSELVTEVDHPTQFALCSIYRIKVNPNFPETLFSDCDTQWYF